MNIVNDYGGSTTPPEHRDSWQTPPEIFAALDRDFRFVADVAASAQNHLLPVYFTEKDDALAQDWAGSCLWGLPGVIRLTAKLHRGCRKPRRNAARGSAP